MFSKLPFVFIGELVEKGRAVFTAQAIPKGSVVELCPVLVLSPDDCASIHQTKLHDYYFLWGTSGSCAIALGFGSIYNHATNANADYQMLLDEKYIKITASRDIEAHEEITLNYMDGGAQESKLWFEEK